ncbi:hypothetical protein HK096_003821 [Nowakowskiella sp. JEL0078]|nr:hypothetical protein HK096_003821 [Nowakowskiella sp. JEL0078]
MDTPQSLADSNYFISSDNQPQLAVSNSDFLSSSPLSVDSSDTLSTPISSNPDSTVENSEFLKYVSSSYPLSLQTPISPLNLGGNSVGILENMNLPLNFSSILPLDNKSVSEFNSHQNNSFQPFFGNEFLMPDIDGNFFSEVPVNFSLPISTTTIDSDVSLESDLHILSEQILDSSMIELDGSSNEQESNKANELNNKTESESLTETKLISESTNKIDDDSIKRKRTIRKCTDVSGSNTIPAVTSVSSKRQKHTRPTSAGIPALNPPSPPSSDNRSVSPEIKPILGNLGALNLAQDLTNENQVAAFALSLQLQAQAQQQIQQQDLEKSDFGRLTENLQESRTESTLQHNISTNFRGVSMQQQAAMFHFSVSNPQIELLASKSKTDGKHDRKPSTKSTEIMAPAAPSRKVAHNAIERRYRNNINDRILELRQVVPALSQAKVKKGAHGSKNSDYDSDTESESEDKQISRTKIADGIPVATKLNKATVLKKATDYIIHLKRVAEYQRGVTARLRTLVEQMHNGPLVVHLFDEDERRKEEEANLTWLEEDASREKEECERKGREKKEKKKNSKLEHSKPAGPPRHLAVWLLFAAAVAAPSPFESFAVFSDTAHIHSQSVVVDDDFVNGINNIAGLNFTNIAWMVFRLITVNNATSWISTTIYNILISPPNFLSSPILVILTYLSPLLPSIHFNTNQIRDLETTPMPSSLWNWLRLSALNALTDADLCVLNLADAISRLAKARDHFAVQSWKRYVEASGLIESDVETTIQELAKADDDETLTPIERVNKMATKLTLRYLNFDGSTIPEFSRLWANEELAFWIDISKRKNLVSSNMDWSTQVCIDVLDAIRIKDETALAVAIEKWCKSDISNSDIGCVAMVVTFAEVIRFLRDESFENDFSWSRIVISVRCLLPKVGMILVADKDPNWEDVVSLVAKLQGDL